MTSLFPDLPRELATTRRVLKRIPEEHFAWKVHEKSMSLGQLAMHVATMPHWMTLTLSSDGLDMANPPQITHEVRDHAFLMQTFDDEAAAVERAIAAVDDTALAAPWTLRNGDQVLYTQSRTYVLRVWCISHMIHHRAQLCVYLRMLNLPVPAVYFNSADEPDWHFD